MKKINLKQPKYILPLIALPFVLMVGYFFNQFSEGMSKDKSQLATSKDISTDFGSIGERSDIKGKTDAYADFFDKRTDGRTMIDGFGDEQDSLQSFDDNLSYRQKRYVDSLDMPVKKKNSIIFPDNPVSNPITMQWMEGKVGKGKTNSTNAV